MNTSHPTSQKLRIFRAGRRTDSSGTTIDFTEADLLACAAGYDPALHEAPLVVGHPKDNHPAYGWVNHLEVQGGDLLAAPKQVEPVFLELVESGRFKKISASFYLPGSPTNPKPGIYYLRHVGFLGARPPAVKGLGDAVFREGEEGVVTMEFGEGGDTVSSKNLFNSLRRWIGERFGQGDADSAIPESLLSPGAMVASGQSDHTEEDVSMHKPGGATLPTPQDPTEQGVSTQPKPADQSPNNPPPTAFSEADAAELRVQIKQLQDAARRGEMTSFVDSSIAAGKVLPGQKPGMVAFMMSMDEQGVVTFGEPGQEKKTTPLEWFKEYVAALPAQVSFGEYAPGTVPAPGKDPTFIANAATEYRDKEKAAGRHISFAEAVEHVQGGVK